jgi:hypothetical protein
MEVMAVHTMKWNIIKRNKIVLFWQHKFPKCQGHTRSDKTENKSIWKELNVYPVDGTTDVYKAKWLSHFNKLPKFTLHYKVRSKHGNELRTELAPVHRRCKLLITYYNVFQYLKTE